MSTFGYTFDKHLIIIETHYIMPAVEFNNNPCQTVRGANMVQQESGNDAPSMFFI